MLTITRCKSIPAFTIDAALYDNPERALAAVVVSAVEPSPAYVERIQAIAEGMPLLAGKTLQYAEISLEKLEDGDLNPSDSQGIRSVFFDHPAMVIMDTTPIMFIHHDLVKELGGIDESTLHHELVHAEQVLRGDSRITEEGMHWKEDFQSKEEAFNLSAALHARDPGAVYVYLNLPWEEEAFRRSEGDDSYFNKRMDAAIKSLFFNVQQHGRVDDDPFSLEDYRYGFLSLCADALGQEGAGSDMEAVTGAAFQQVLEECHVNLDDAQVASLRDVIHATLAQAGEVSPFPIEQDRNQVCINLYLACQVWLRAEYARQEQG
ncbi:hypothetical protein VRRI112168_02755 [Vreelandella rituensis]|uniref:Uncharacterized protein n=1 Tax=Vreelandella rituensis TaxID=2282306 RepID=A0A368U9Q4_9GAMM|nr:hypothetical protein [Halomonas rituensis]RCV93664.1 hypothetical protein DU506_00475 [Halomonas rituensis]